MALLQDLEEKESRQVVVTFLGFHCHESCFENLHDELRNEGYECIEASPQGLNTHGCCANVDGCCWYRFRIHLGLGSIERQARTAQRCLNGQLRAVDEIILLGHSQGGLIAMKYWERYHKIYNIIGMITITTPWQGVALIESLGSRQRLQQAAKDNDGQSSGCCLSACLACFFPCCLVPTFKCLGSCCCQGLTDLIPGSGLTLSMSDICANMKNQKFPLMNITAICPAPEEFSRLPYGRQGIKELLGTADDSRSDNVLATKYQLTPLTWPQMRSEEIEADHGVFTVKKPSGGYYSFAFCSRATLDKVSDFCRLRFHKTKD